MKTRFYPVREQKTALIQFIYEIFPPDSPFRNTFEIDTEVIAVTEEELVDVHFSVRFGEAQEESAYVIVDHEEGITFFPETDELGKVYERAAEIFLRGKNKGQS